MIVAPPCVYGVAPSAAYQPRFVTVDGARIRYFAAGSGPPLLLLHGMGGNATNWFCVSAELAKSHRVIAIDQLGFGRSDKPRREYGAQLLAESAHGVIRALGLGPVVVVGASMGGDVAARLAASHPSDVAKLVLVDSSGLPLTPRKGDLPRDPRTLEEQKAILDAIFVTPHFVTPELVRQRLETHLANGDSYTLRHWGWNEPDLETLLPRVRAPALVIWGSDDPIWPPATARKYARRLRHARVRVIDGAGHAPYLEKPAAFAAALIEFLR